MKISTLFHESDSASARFGITVYSNGTESCSTIHTLQIGASGEVEQLGGRPLTDSELKEILYKLVGNRTKSEVLPANVLSYVKGRIAWWTPVQHRVVFFNTSDKEFSAECNGKVSLWPPLVFIATPRDLRVFALPASERPSADTELMVAPCYNVYAGGKMCQESVPMPKTPELSNLAQYESAFFDSVFTHTNAGGKWLTSWPYGGHNGLWRMLIAQTHNWFPYVYLMPAKNNAGNPLTLAEAINQ